MSPIRVIKIGGSLLQRQGLLSDLHSWQSTLVDQMANVWITGGGAAVDALRKQDQTLGLSNDAAHWASIKAMDDNTATLARRLSNWQITNEPKDVLQLADKQTNNLGSPQLSTKNWLLQTHRWIKSTNNRPGSHQQLPRSWDVTSDSIAAWVAIQLRASQLILLKSCLVPTATIPKLARLGIVDPYLQTFDLQRHGIQFTCKRLPCTRHGFHEKVTANN